MTLLPQDSTESCRLLLLLEACGAAIEGGSSSTAGKFDVDGNIVGIGGTDSPVGKSSREPLRECLPWLLARRLR